MLNIKSIHYPYLLYKTRPKPIRPGKNIKMQKHKMDFQRNHKPWMSGLWDEWFVGVSCKVSKENFETYCQR